MGAIYRSQFAICCLLGVWGYTQGITVAEQMKILSKVVDTHQETYIEIGGKFCSKL